MEGGCFLAMLVKQGWSGGKSGERTFYAVKYATHVVKLCIICTFKREIIHMSSPHLGTESDGGIGRRTIDSLPLFAWERFLADGPYESSRFCSI